MLVIASWNLGTNTGEKMLTDPLFKMLRFGIPGFPVNFDSQYVKISEKQGKDFHLTRKH